MAHIALNKEVKWQGKDWSKMGCVSMGQIILSPKGHAKHLRILAVALSKRVRTASVKAFTTQSSPLGHHGQSPEPHLHSFQEFRGSVGLQRGFAINRQSRYHIAKPQLEVCLSSWWSTGNADPSGTEA